MLNGRRALGDRNKSEPPFHDLYRQERKLSLVGQSWISSVQTLRVGETVQIALFEVPLVI